MKRVMKWMVVVGGGFTGASLFAKRRKQQAWEDEPRGEAEFPPLLMEHKSEPDDRTDTVDSATASDGWVDSLPDGNCPESHPVKGKVRSGIYHVDGNIAYDRTNADRCYISTEAAAADGFRAAKT